MWRLCSPVLSSATSSSTPPFSLSLPLLAPPSPSSPSGAISSSVGRAPLPLLSSVQSLGRPGLPGPLPRLWLLQAARRSRHAAGVWWAGRGPGRRDTQGLAVLLVGRASWPPGPAIAAENWFQSVLHSVLYTCCSGQSCDMSHCTVTTLPLPPTSLSLTAATASILCLSAAHLYTRHPVPPGLAVPASLPGLTLATPSYSHLVPQVRPLPRPQDGRGAQCRS